MKMQVKGFSFLIWEFVDFMETLSMNPVVRFSVEKDPVRDSKSLEVKVFF